MIKATRKGRFFFPLSRLHLQLITPLGARASWERGLPGSVVYLGARSSRERGRPGSAVVPGARSTWERGRPGAVEKVPISSSRDARAPGGEIIYHCRRDRVVEKPVDSISDVGCAACCIPIPVIMHIPGAQQATHHADFLFTQFSQQLQAVRVLALPKKEINLIITKYSEFKV